MGNFAVKVRLPQDTYTCSGYLVLASVAVVDNGC